MPVNPDYRELFRLLSEEKVEYLIVGAYAVTYYAEPRYTKDLDILIRPSLENAKKAWAALERFDAPLLDIAVADLTDPELVYQIGVEPNRIDVHMGITGVDFEKAWQRRVESTYGGVPISLVSREDLITAKKASGRPQDLLDLERLQEP
jgi:hypothetical protein